MQLSFQWSSENQNQIPSQVAPGKRKFTKTPETNIVTRTYTHTFQYTYAELSESDAEPEDDVINDPTYLPSDEEHVDSDVTHRGSTACLPISVQENHEHHALPTVTSNQENQPPKDAVVKKKMTRYENHLFN